jgi:dTDP-glucose 4,6-dehydratase
MTRFLRYSSDLAIWLWTFLFKGEACHPYNVGSDQEITISQLAHTVASTLGGSVESLATSAPGNASPSRYVPFIGRAGDELGLQVHIELARAIASTSTWGRLLE